MAAERRGRAVTAEEALQRARHLAKHGVPLFIARPDPGAPTGFQFPGDWQHTEPDPAVVDRWKPGWALCAVMGHVVDAIDVDLQHEGDLASLNGARPRSYGVARTPSGGRHHLVATLGVRSFDGLFQGIDFKAGDAEGRGRGFVFIAPTVRKSKTTGEPTPYEWIEPPDIEALYLLGGDDTGTGLRGLIEGKRSKIPDPPVGPLVPRPAGDVAGDLERRVYGPMRRTPAGQRNDMLNRVACVAGGLFARLAEEDRQDDLSEVRIKEKLQACVVDDGDPGKTRATIASGWTHGVDHPIDDDEPGALQDVPLAEWLARHDLADWRWASGIGWLHWDGRRWEPLGEEFLRDAMGEVAQRINRQALERGDANRLRDTGGLLRSARITGIITHLRAVLAVPGGDFDQRPDLLCVGNGVVDLRTGRLGPHDRELLLTRISPVDYVPDATHPDWDKALRALDPEVVAWMQVRIGQAATGHPTSDDVLPIGQGSGSNGKSTITEAIARAMGDHYTVVADKVLLARPDDHPTELVSLRGARLAVVDETPEAGRLNVARLKRVLGQERITARAIRRDNITFKTSHSLFIWTNHRPIVAETDYGTWRRLALVRFDKTFPRDDRFREALRSGADGRAEAVLAWIVKGARQWYADGRHLPDAPARVVADTRAWREDTDLVLRYVGERLEFDPGACVTSSDLLDDVNEWLHRQGHSPWSTQLVTARFGEHQEVTSHHVHAAIRKSLPGLSLRPGSLHPRPGSPTRVWLGVRFNGEVR